MSPVNELVDLYDQAPCGYHSLDADGRFVRVNETERRWLECTREELIGRAHIREFLTAEGQALLARNFPILLQSGTIKNVEFDLVSRSGVMRRMIASASSVRHPDGSFMMTRTVMYDISELHRTRAELQRVTAEQHAVIDTDLIGILKLRNRHIVWANRGAERLLGYAPGELLGQPKLKIYSHESTHRAVGENAYPRLRVGEHFRAQLELIRKDGQTLWVDMSAAALQSETADSLWTMTDITALRQAESVRARTGVLEAENRQLQEASRFKSMFLANMSHELRTPLNAVLGYAQVLQTGSVRPGTPQFARYLSQIGTSGAQLLELIDNVLHFARLESDRLEFAPEPLDLQALAHDVIENQQGEIRRKALRVSVEIEPAVSFVVGDKLRLTQMVSAYVSNAVKFVSSGGRVALRARPEGETMFRFEVEDNGIGVAEADLGRLFAAFQQLSEGNTKTATGVGLGLALTRRLAEAQGGRTGVTSTLGVGSVFHFELPRQGTQKIDTADA